MLPVSEAGVVCEVNLHVHLTAFFFLTFKPPCVYYIFVVECFMVSFTLSSSTLLPCWSSPGTGLEAAYNEIPNTQPVRISYSDP